MTGIQISLSGKLKRAPPPQNRNSSFPHKCCQENQEHQDSWIQNVLVPPKTGIKLEGKVQRSRQNRRSEEQEWSRKQPFIGSFPKETKHFWAGARQMDPPNQKPPFSNKVKTPWVRKRGQSQITECVLVPGRMAPVFEPEASLPRIEQAPSGSFPWLMLHQSCSQNLKSHYFWFYHSGNRNW